MRIAFLVVIGFAFPMVPLEHLLRLGDQAVGFGNAKAKRLLAGLHLARLLFTSTGSTQFVRHAFLPTDLGRFVLMTESTMPAAPSLS